MRHICWLVLVMAAGLGGLEVGTAQDKKDRGTVIDGLKSEVPADWIKEKPSNNLRIMQFRVPKVEGDSVDAEVSVNKGISGTPDQNLERWKKMFVPPEGKVTEMKLGKGKAWYLDISGTYLYKSAPFDPNAKVEKRPDNRMLAIQYEGDEDVYHFKLVGPAKTVDKHKKGFDDWIKGLK